MQSDPIQRHFLTIEQAKDEIRAMGIAVSDRQVRRWAYERVLPFFRLGRHLYIERNELGMQIWRLQLDAIRLHGKAGARAGR